MQMPLRVFGFAAFCGGDAAMPHSIVACLELSKKTFGPILHGICVSLVLFPHHTAPVWSAGATRTSPIGRIGWTSRNLMPSSACDHGTIVRNRYEPAAS